MTQAELENIYEALAQGIDAVRAEQTELYLAKIALALAELSDNVGAARAIIEECKTGLVD